VARQAQAGEDTGLPLNPKYLFESFVVGNSNRFAHAAAQGVAEKLGASHNPLVLYGGVGLGKTHLLHAIGNYIKGRYPLKRVVYTTSEKFTNDMIKCLKDQHMSEFRRKYRNMDLLLIDDIQFLQGKESIQEEFFHTFNDLLSVQHQIVATSDTHPKDIKVEERLRSRFQGGLIADLQPPDIETRTAILQKKAEFDHLQVPEEVLAVIASAVQSNIRELEGALNRVIAFAATSCRSRNSRRQPSASRTPWQSIFRSKPRLYPTAPGPTPSRIPARLRCTSAGSFLDLPT
jgi:chromosomal replication initiator protein